MTSEEIIDAFCKEVKKNAYPKYDAKTCGKCATAIREVIEKVLSPKKVKRVLSAKDYGPSYEKLGFIKVFNYPEQDKTLYKKQKGDLCILDYEPHGHICIYIGREWISDFCQIDMYGGKIRDENPPLSIYRFQG